MIRAILYFAGIVAVTVALAWLADQPGSIDIKWGGYEFSSSIFVAVIGLSFALFMLWLAWSAFTSLLSSPAMILNRLRQRRNKKSLTALSRGLIAVGAGDARLARKYAKQAARGLPNEPMSALLRAQAAQLAGDRLMVQRIYESMLESPETELLGLRGLFSEAKREQQLEAARQYAERALKLNNSVRWAAEGLLNLQCRAQDWKGALETLQKAKFGGSINRHVLKRWKAVLLTARAQELEDTDPQQALQMALDAHALAPDLVPAAEIAGRLLANDGNIKRAAQIIRKTWRLSPHPDLATAFAYLRHGDSPRDRLQRIEQLARDLPNHIESRIALAHAAIEARNWKQARNNLKPLIENNPSARVCTLMARIEGGEFGDKGRVREWLARALRAPRDPVWIADGHISDSWEPVSPISGRLDAFEWRVPDQRGMTAENDLILDDLMALPTAPTPVPPSVGTAGQSTSTEIVAVEDLEPEPDEPGKTSASRTRSVDSATDIEETATDLSENAEKHNTSGNGAKIPPDDPGPDYDESELDKKTQNGRVQPTA